MASGSQPLAPMPSLSLPVFAILRLLALGVSLMFIGCAEAPKVIPAPKSSEAPRPPVPAPLAEVKKPVPSLVSLARQKSTAKMPQNTSTASTNTEFIKVSCPLFSMPSEL